MLIGAQAYPIEFADDEADIKTFNDRHNKDTAVLFFVNLESQEQSGFWASIFNLFGSSAESDEALMEKIGQKDPVLKIDIGKEKLAHSAKDFSVDSVPFIVAFYNGEEVLRETPNSGIASKLDGIIRGKEQDKQAKATPTDDADGHNHPKPVIVESDYGHLNLNDPKYKGLSPIQILDLETGSNIADNAVDTINDQLLQFKKNNEPVFTVVQPAIDPVVKSVTDTIKKPAASTEATTTASSSKTEGTSASTSTQTNGVVATMATNAAREIYKQYAPGSSTTTTASKDSKKDSTASASASTSTQSNGVLATMATNAAHELYKHYAPGSSTTSASAPVHTRSHTPHSTQPAGPVQARLAAGATSKIVYVPRR